MTSSSPLERPPSLLLTVIAFAMQYSSVNVTDRASWLVRARDLDANG
jgi:hypothetical protein